MNPAAPRAAEQSCDRYDSLLTRIEGRIDWAAIPKECRSTIWNKYHLEIIFKKSFAPTPGHTPAGIDASLIYDAYLSYWHSFFYRCALNGNREMYLSCIRSYGKNEFNYFGQLLDALADGQILQSIKNLGSDYYSLMTENHVKLLKIFHRLVSAGSANAMLDIAKSSARMLSTQEKITLVQMLGIIARTSYDTKRRDDGIKSEGVVGLGEMQDVWRYNIISGYGRADNNLLGIGKFSGVCRDIASAQGVLLQTMGFKDTYVISRGHAGTSLYHSSVITLDPDTRSTLYHLDYGNMHANATGDARALFVGQKDVAINYWISRPGGQTVDNIQSELGKFLSTAAGFDIRRIDPLARNHGSVIGFDFYSSSIVETRILSGYGTDGNGAQYVYSGVNMAWDVSGFFPGRAGAVVAAQMQNAGRFSESDFNYNMSIFFLQIEQMVRTGGIFLTKSLKARIEAYATLIFAAGALEGGDETYKIIQGDMRFGANLKFYHRLWKDRFQATYLFGIQASPGLDDIRNNHYKQGGNAMITHLLFSAEGRLRLAGSGAGKAYLLAAATVLYDLLGYRGRIEAGIELDKFYAGAQLEGRLTGDTLAVQDGAARQVVVNLAWSPTKVISFMLSGFISLEDKRSTGLVFNTLFSY